MSLAKIEWCAATPSCGFTAGGRKDHARSKPKVCGRPVTDAELDGVAGEESR